MAELVTNAVLHARSGFTIDVSSAPHAVRIAVGDASPARAEPRDAWLVATSGRGLGIVAALAHQSDGESIDAGKTIWAELQRRR